MDILRFRVVLDSEEQVFRDIEISSEDNYELLHHTVVEAFGMNEGEMSSFYVSNDQWEKGEEIPLFDMGTSEQPMPSMAENHFKDNGAEVGYRLLYVFDFMNLKIFYLELVAVIAETEEHEYPRISMRYGDNPVFKDDMDFEMTTEDLSGDGEDDYHDPYDDGYGDDEFGGHENIDDLDGLI